MSRDDEGGCVEGTLAGRPIHISFGGVQRRMRLAGEVFYFEWHHRMGPCLQHKNGREKKAPPQEHPWWRNVQAWHDQGSRVDAEGWCVWDPPVPRKVWGVKVGRDWLMVPEGTPDAVLLREEWPDGSPV